MEQSGTGVATPEQPAPAAPQAIPIEQAELSYKEQRDLTRAGKTTVIPGQSADAKPAPETPAVKPDDEAASTKADAEISDAAHTLRKNRADERRRQIQSEIDELTATKHRLRAEIEADERARAARPHTVPSRQPVDDPNDPQPTLESVLQQFPDDPDPYLQLSRQTARWEARQVVKEESAQRQSESAARAHAQTRASYEAKAREFSAQHADYDATVDALNRAVSSPQRDPNLVRDINDAVYQAALELGPSFVYHLAKSPGDIDAMLNARNPRDIHHAIGALTFRLAQAAAAPRPQPTPVPAPHQPTAGSGTTVVPAKDEAEMSTSEFLRHRRAQRQARSA